jgi:penicillin-binding protein 1C
MTLHWYAPAWARSRTVRATLHTLLGIMSAGMLVMAAFLASSAFVEFPSFGRFSAPGPTSEARLLDRHGIALQRMRMDATRRQLDWVRLADVSPALLRALIAAEDHGFYSHHGVDAFAMLAGVAASLRGVRRGASTISMQVVSLLADEAPADHRHGPLGKMRQARDALALERSWTKQQILEAYVNLLHFRNDLVGIDAASRGLLGTGPGGLDDAQSAVLAALVRAPSARRTQVARRACGVLREMHRPDACKDAQYIADGLPSRPRPIASADGQVADHLAHALLHTPGVDVHSTLDGDLQRFAVQTLRARLSELTERNVEDGAIVVLDNQTGDVLAYVGSSGNLSRAGQVDGILARRQPGSALKPFLYAEAIEQRWLTAASILQDAPFSVDTAGGLYAPQDYERDYKGTVSVRTALAASLNVPAVRTLELVGVGRLHQRLHDLGFTSLTADAQHYGVGLALGDGEVTLLELANAYRTLANAGVWSPTRVALDQPMDPTRRRVFSAPTSFIIGDILSDNAARAPTFGFSSPLSTRTWAAVKTGTSKGMRDNWTIGYTDRYTVAAWVGNSSGAPMWDVSGVSGAAPIWQTLVEYLHESVASRAPPTPSGTVRQDVHFGGGVEATRAEWFLPGTELSQLNPPAPELRPQLLEPADGTRVAPDPDIPPSHQRIRIRANVSGDAARCLQLDGKALAKCGDLDILSALPAPGAHRITLNDIQGAVLAEVHIEIRAPRESR